MHTSTDVGEQEGGDTNVSTVPDTAPVSVDFQLIAYRVTPGHCDIVPASRSRDWMDATTDRFAYRCLPLAMGNLGGWFILNPQRFRAAWNGGVGLDAVTVDYGDKRPVVAASSHFGHGLLTWNLPFIFRTPPGWNLLVRGPTNWPLPGLTPLDAIVETDWAVATFTMNWKFTAVSQWVTFEAGDPLCMIVPQRRHELEHWCPRLEAIDAAPPEFRESYQRWRDSRGQFIVDQRFDIGDARRRGFQRHYLRGVTLHEHQAPEHQVHLRLQRFRDATTARRGSAIRVVNRAHRPPRRR